MKDEKTEQLEKAIDNLRKKNGGEYSRVYRDIYLTAIKSEAAKQYHAAKAVDLDIIYEGIRDIIKNEPFHQVASARIFDLITSHLHPKTESEVSDAVDKWISVETPPKLKIIQEGLLTTIQNSVECIVTDGETTWVDYFSFDEGFHESITHYQLLPQPPTKGRGERNG